MKVKYVIIILMFAFYLNGVELKIVENIQVSSNDSLLQRPTYFCVTENDVIFLTDTKAADIKVFNNEGEIIKTLGKKGPGPGEFLMPFGCSYDKRKFIVMDFMKKKFFIYEIQGKYNFKFIREFSSLQLGYSIRLKGQDLLIAGYKADKNDKPFDLYIQNLMTDAITFLLPSEKKYGFASAMEYRNNFRNKFELDIIGLDSFCDWGENCCYFVWIGDLKILKIDLTTKEIRSFGQKTSRYIKPFVSKAMLNAHKKRNLVVFKSERSKMSFVTGIFSCDAYVGIIYNTPAKNSSDNDVIIQIYNPDGTFLKEWPLAELKGVSYLSYFRKKGEFLYFFLTKVDENANESYSILKCKISK